MAKMDLNVVKESQETIANRMDGKILREDDFESFRQFISHDFGEINKENKRKAKGLTQAVLGEQVELPQSYIGGIEKGERNISLDTLQKLLSALHISPSELFREYDNKDANLKEIIESLDRISIELSKRSVKEVKLIESFVINILKTLDDLKNID
ncbi:helix-turn-helix domain-containing protein [Paenibacillus jamilae]|uniref:helix-turn-helix domain-containing protein n=1 Tax=Paenibacillus jamilae TaxID=114136 RepID=UPI003D2DB75E